MWLSTRNILSKGDDDWLGYIEFIKLPHLKEVRTIDPWVNKIVDGSLFLTSLDEVEEVLAMLQPPEPVKQYSQLLVNVSDEEIAPQDVSRFHFLGYDLSDETHTSSLLNCGPWTGILAPMTQRLNQYGLLSLEDAKLAQELLPSVWENDAHAYVDIWALFEVSLYLT